MGMKRYKVTLPTQEECIAKGFKFDGQEVRSRLWLVGVASGIAYAVKAINGGAYKIKFDVSFVGRNYFMLDCDSPVVMDQVAAQLTDYACTVAEVSA